MKMQTVLSSNITAIGYDKKTLIFRVRFKSGKLYEYCKVPYMTFKQLIKVVNLGYSIGGFFNDHIKTGGYKWRKIEGKKDNG